MPVERPGEQLRNERGGEEIGLRLPGLVSLTLVRRLVVGMGRQEELEQVLQGRGVLEDRKSVV